MIYVGVMDTSDEGAYGIFFPDLNGCAAMGDTKVEALTNAQEAMSAWFGLWPHPFPPASSKEELENDPEIIGYLADGAELVEVSHEL